MGATGLSQYLRPGRTSHTLDGIRYNHPKEATVYVGIDISVIMVQSLKIDAAVEQYYMQPPVPVTEAISYTKTRLIYLRRLVLFLSWFLMGRITLWKIDGPEKLAPSTLSLYLEETRQEGLAKLVELEEIPVDLCEVKPAA
jgi:hypothetical protein